MTSESKVNIDLFDFWESTIIDTLSLNGISKRTHIAYTPLNITVPYSLFRGGLNMSWPDINYKDGRKLTNLRNWYYPEDLKETIQTAINLLNPKYGSISTPMVNKEKNVRGSKGHCIQAITVTRHYKKVYFSFFYRSVELCRAWLADLKFLSEIVLPEITDGIKGDPYQVSFHFSNANIEAITTIFFIIRSKRGIEYLDKLESVDQHVFKSFLKLIFPVYLEPVRYSQLKRALRQQKNWEVNRHLHPELDRTIIRYFHKYGLMIRKRI